MNKVDLIKQEHNVKVGDDIPNLAPNLTEDTLFMEGCEVIGFYIRDISKYSVKLANFINIANNEFRSDRVPKSLMRRSSALNAVREGGKGVEQYSTIIGSVPPKPHMRRSYPSISSVHSVKSADVFVKAMLLACKEAELVMKEIAPDVYHKQHSIIENEVDPQWRFGNLFTSSISNYNISASAHIDTGNIKECVNVIITKRKNSTGGNLHLPDYNVTIDCCDNSMVVYPAWKSIHAVTPIHPQEKNGYRNSLIFYPLKAFLKVYG
jgi:hypothetical protein